MRQRDENAALQTVAHMEQGRVVTLDSPLAIDAAVFALKYKLPYSYRTNKT